MASNSFGRYLRAARARYGHDEILKAWVRVSEADGLWRLECYPESELVPSERHDRKQKYQIWYVEGRKTLTDMSEALQKMAPLKEAKIFYLNDDGGLVL